MRSRIIIVLARSSLFRRPRYWSFPFMYGWMGSPHGMDWRYGMGGGLRSGPHGCF